MFCFSSEPDNPNCTQLLVLKTSNTVTINTSTLITAGAVFHEFLFNNKTKRVFLNETTKSFYNLTSSHLYDLEVYSFGDTSTGNQKSDRSCKMNIVTSEYWQSEFEIMSSLCLIWLSARICYTKKINICNNEESKKQNLWI